MVSKPSPIDIKVAIMGAKGYPYVYGGYDTLVKELGERLVEKGVSVRVYNHRSLFSTRPRFVNGIECIYTPAIETKSLTQLSHTFFDATRLLFGCGCDFRGELWQWPFRLAHSNFW